MPVDVVTDTVTCTFEESLPVRVANIFIGFRCQYESAVRLALDRPFDRQFQKPIYALSLLRFADVSLLPNLERRIAISHEECDRP
jgi:hypothetical protein